MTTENDFMDGFTHAGMYGNLIANSQIEYARGTLSIQMQVCNNLSTRIWT